MRAGAVLLTGCAGLALAACHPAKFGELRNERPYLVSSRLICPSRQGELELRDSAGDGRSCRYTGDGGTEVTLQLAALDGRAPQAALGEVEAQLKAAMPPANGEPLAGTVDAAVSDGNTLAQGNAIASRGDWDDDGHDRAGREDREEAHINLPFFHVDTHGSKAQVSMPGVHINADGDRAQVEVNKPGGKLVTVNADARGAEVRTGDITPRNVNVTYMLAAKDGHGEKERGAGYIAKGPIGGPLVLATVKGPSDDRDSDTSLFRDAKKLVNRNVRRG